MKKSLISWYLVSVVFLAAPTTIDHIDPPEPSFESAPASIQSNQSAALALRDFVPTREVLFLASTASASTTEPQYSPEQPPIETTEPTIALQAVAAQTVAAQEDTQSHLPARLLIPAIGLDAPIEGVGVNEKGDMDVPSGKTNNTGWYESGTVPGDVGSAVVAAHVYAAFSNLHQLPLGSEVYVVMKNGKKLRFVVEEAVTTALKETSREKLFNQHDARRLNLITCAGEYLPSLGTYDHRLVLYTKFVDES